MSAPAHAPAQQERKERRSLPVLIKEWFGAGTAATQFLKGLLALLVASGVTAGGVAGYNAISASPGSFTPSPPKRTALSAALLQPCDLGTCDGIFGWVPSSATSVSNSGGSCPALPAISAANHVATALEYDPTGDTVDEDIWHLANPRQAVATFVSTAQRCSFPVNGGQDFLTPDDSVGTFADASAVDLLSNLPAGYAPQYATITAVTAVIARGNMLAFVTLYLGPQSSAADQSNFVQNILPDAVGKLR
jgi:hypothetical protein